MRHNSLLIVIVAALAQAPGVRAQFSGSFNGQPGIDISGAWSPSPHEESVGNPAIADFLGTRYQFVRNVLVQDEARNAKKVVATDSGEACRRMTFTTPGVATALALGKRSSNAVRPKK